MTDKKSIRWEHPEQMEARLQRRQQAPQGQLRQWVRQVVSALAERLRYVNSLLVEEEPVSQAVPATGRRRRTADDLAA